MMAKHPAWQGESDAHWESIAWIRTRRCYLYVGLEEKDIPVLFSAIVGTSNYLVTGDKRDFGPPFGISVKGGRW
jgi:hypothetical protein